MQRSRVGNGGSQWVVGDLMTPDDERPSAMVELQAALLLSLILAVLIETARLVLGIRVI